MLDSIVRHAPFLRLDRRAEFITKLFENDLRPQSCILDIGGGWGFYKEPLEKRNHSHAVLEVTPPGYQRAPVILYDPAKPFPFNDKSFDSSLIVTALHHMPDPAAVLKEARRVTRDCVIVVEDLYHHSLGRLWTILRDQIYNLEFFGHPCQFRKKGQWLEMFRDLGFTVQRHQEIYTWMAGMRILNGLFVLKV